MRRKIVMIVAALLCGVLGTALLVRFVQGAESRALEGEQLVDVFVVTDYIPAGTSSQAMVDGELVQVTQVPLKVRPKVPSWALEEVTGQVAETDLFAGEQLVLDRFVNPDAFDSNPSTVQAPEGYVELTVTMAPTRVMGGFIAPGDTVAVFASFGPLSVEGSEVEIDGQQVQLPDELTSDLSITTPDTTHILMHKVLVTEVQVEEIQVQPVADPNGLTSRSLASCRRAASSSPGAPDA